jgi:hypothetical protein
MAPVLSAPLAAAALVLVVAGLAKLRAPGPAAQAVRLPPLAIRLVAVAELALAGLAVAGPSPRLAAVAMAAVYAAFAALTLRLARAGSSCGCFGMQPSAASPIQSLLSLSLAGLCLLAALVGASGPAGWLASQPMSTAVVLSAGVGAIAYAIVLAYTELPELWRSWSPA